MTVDQIAGVSDDFRVGGGVGHGGHQLAAARLRSRMLLQVHDELIFEVAPGELDAVRSLAVAEMGVATSLRVPLEVSTGTGRSWSDAAH